MQRFNVIMILLDGLRADRLNLCPSLSKILKKGHYFPNMITAAPYTLASFHSIFSGLYPSKNGVNSYFNMFKFKKDICKTLTQYLKEGEYYTETDLPGEDLIPSQGFDKYRLHDEFKINFLKRHTQILHQIRHKNPFFLFLRYGGLHINIVKTVIKKYTDFDESFFKNYGLNKKRYNSYLKEYK